MVTAQEMEQRLKARGKRITAQRRRIFAALDGNDAHPTAEAVWDAVRADLPDVSLRTVYQTLHELADVGALEVLDLGTGAARFDPNADPHHHLVCDRCGRVEDLPAETAGVRIPGPAVHGYEISRTEITFRGRCPSCRDDATDTSSAVGG